MDEEPVMWPTILDDRQRKELALARLYAKDFAHGTTGHNQLMLINKLGEMLDRVEKDGMSILKLYFPKEG